MSRWWKSKAGHCWFEQTERPAAPYFWLLWSSENRKHQTERRPSRVGPQTNRPAGNRRVQAWRKQETLTGRGQRGFHNAELWMCVSRTVCVWCLCFCWYFNPFLWLFQEEGRMRKEGPNTEEEVKGKGQHSQTIRETLRRDRNYCKELSNNLSKKGHLSLSCMDPLCFC